MAVIERARLKTKNMDRHVHLVTSKFTYLSPDMMRYVSSLRPRLRKHPNSLQTNLSFDIHSTMGFPLCTHTHARFIHYRVEPRVCTSTVCFSKVAFPKITRLRVSSSFASALRCS